MQIDRAIAELRRFWAQHSRMPSYHELAACMGYASKQAAYRLATRLIEEGMLARDVTGKLVPGERLFGVPLAGVVEAGPPSPAEVSALETLSLDAELVAGGITYALRVKGDSMQGAGILEGDLVLVESVTDAPVGSIVVAQIDGEWTLKYLRETSTYGRVVRYLEAANPAYPDLYPVEDLRISGVVRAVLRKY
jgi:SOS-response transcriptional repressor LexA